MVHVVLSVMEDIMGVEAGLCRACLRLCSAAGESGYRWWGQEKDIEAYIARARLEEKSRCERR